MKNTIAIFIIALFCNINALLAQEEFPHVEGDLLVKVEKGYTIEQIVKELANHKGLETKIQAEQLLSKNLDIWRMTFDSKVLTHSMLLAKARSCPMVQEAQLNYITEKRATPNDPSYGQQWQYEQASDFDLDASAAWDITTGGVTALGDTIVVCVIDDGIEVSHPDWGDNIWYNRGEIAGNGIDDDGNGYIDDYRGWNADDNTNDILPPNPWNTHGTPVAGIVAAQGNNGIGVSGVNWNVKLMFVVGGGTNAAALAAYDYPLSCRKLYNQTNGALGAFVVATNASWGVNNQDCSTYAPLVNSMYDSLGAAGVLNAAATANANTDVDVQGDFPTTCTSDYLVAVTNIQQSGTKVTSAGYGSTHIDLGAYGEGTYTIATSASYAGFGGTSGATPHVTGTIGLLYAAPCPRLALLARTQPAQTAMMMKQILLNSSVQNTTLQGITVSGGVLNMKNALDSVMNIGCSLAGCHEPYNALAANITGTTTDFNWDRVDSTSIYYYRYRVVGSTTWMQGNVPDTFAVLSGLIACTDYEFEVAANCDSSVYSATTIFKTGDCCAAPGAVTTVNEGLTTASFSWSNVAFANNYTIEYKLKSDTTWTTTTATLDSITLLGLDSCSVYELRILSSCNINVNNQYSSIVEFETAGCGSCTKAGYCPSVGNASVDDWLANVTLESINNTTGDDGGYISFVSTGPTTDLGRGGTYPISIDLGYNTGPWATNWRLKVWIDYNQDESFDDVTELAYDAGQISTATATHTGNITIPATARLSRTRMRVSMRWGTNTLMSCSNPNYGEIEDYCVNIIMGTPTTSIDNVVTEWNVYPNPFDEKITIELASEQQQDVVINLTNMTGQKVKTISQNLSKGQNNIVINNQDLPVGMYLLTAQLENGELLTQKVIKK